MKYLSTYLTTAITFIIITASLNWWIDPFGMYWSTTLSGINEVKPEAGNRTRITKAYRAAEIKPHILLVGNSRVEMGLDPHHKAFNNQPTYNQGMPGAGTGMQFDYALDVIASSPKLHTLIIGVDFLDFLVNAAPKDPASTLPKKKPRYWPRLTSLADDSAENQIFRLKEKAAMLLSLDAIAASLKTVTKQSATVSSIDAYGLNTAQTYLDILHHEGIKPLYVQKLQELKKGLQNKSLTTRSFDGKTLTRPFSQLNNLLAKATEKNLSVYLFISPYHYSYLQLLDDLNFRKDFMHWKSQLAKLIDNYSGQQVQLWDFSNFNKFTLEAVPLDAQNQQMQWYWEPAHYKKELGDLIIERMLNRSTHNEFGIRLLKANVNTISQQDHIALDNSKEQWRKLKKSLNILQTN